MATPRPEYVAPGVPVGATGPTGPNGAYFGSLAAPVAVAVLGFTTGQIVSFLVAQGYTVSAPHAATGGAK
jgi:hypothetical protein